MQRTIRFLSIMMLCLLACQKVHANCCCEPNIIDIDSVPFHIDGTINTSNTTYCVKDNLTYLGGEGMPVAAITVDPGVHDIVINFNGFQLDIDPSVDGISMPGTDGEAITDVIIRDGVIRSSSPSAVNAGIRATNFNTVTVENMRFADMQNGFSADFQTDANFNLTFSKCVFDLKGVAEATRTGIFLGTIQGLKVEECSFLANDQNEFGGQGIYLLNNAKNVLINRTIFDGMRSEPITVQSLFAPEAGLFFTFPSTNIQIDECEFTNTQFLADIGMAGVSNVHVTNCSFNAGPNQLIHMVYVAQSIFPDQVNTPIPSGLLVDHCTFTSSSQGNTFLVDYNWAGIFAGSFNTPGIGARDIIIRNSTFTHQGAPARADDIRLIGAEGVLIENCVFDSTSSGRINNTCLPATEGELVAKSANIHLGGPIYDFSVSEFVDGNGVRDVTIRGNEICGGSQVGIFAETSFGAQANERITIEDNNITALEEGILFENTHSSTIINNRVQGVRGDLCQRGAGIKLTGALEINESAACTSNAILNNVVSNNFVGIRLDCGAQANVVKGNFVFNNELHQIREKKHDTNLIDCNTIYQRNNEHLSCSDFSENR